MSILSRLGSQTSQGSQSKYLEYNSPNFADALITTRDGIVGWWTPPAGRPTPRRVEDAENLRVWESWVCGSVFAFELASRLGFTVTPAAKGSAACTVWHLRTSETDGAPSGVYMPLVRFDRPPEAVFADQLKFLRSYADLRPDRAVEIVEQLDSPVPFLASVGFLRPDVKRWTGALIEVVLDLARLVGQRVKHGLACRRPIEYSPQVQPVVQTPGHGSLPSGHAAEAFATALVLRRLMQAAGTPYDDAGYGEQLMRLASRIAVNRTVAGLHFPIDSVAGALLGLTLGEYFLARVGAVGRMDQGEHVYRTAHFDGTAEDIKDKDFIWSGIYDAREGAVKFFSGGENEHPSVRPFPREEDNRINLAADARSLPLEWLWDKAVEEWT